MASLPRIDPAQVLAHEFPEVCFFFPLIFDHINPSEIEKRTMKFSMPYCPDIPCCTISFGLNFTFAAEFFCGSSEMDCEQSDSCIFV